VNQLQPMFVLQGQDYLAPGAIKYDVIDYAADPRWAPPLREADFAVVRIAGVDATTPTIAITPSEDDVTVGMTVTSVGYGRTVGGNEPNENTKRWFVQKRLDQVGPTLIGYEMRTSGICAGDSGGPVLAGSGTNERIIGVHSFGSGGNPNPEYCNGFGGSARLSFGLSFLNEELTKPLPEESCGLCRKIATSGKNACALMTACLADPECRGYYDCVREGTKSEEECILDHPLAEGPFKAALSCVCRRACTDLCAAEPSCEAAPKCGFSREPNDCTSCIERACCDEQMECAADGRCYLCLKNGDADPACATNPQRKKLETCMANACKEQCGGGNGGAAPEPPAAEPEPEPPAPTSRPEKSGCAASPAAPGTEGIGLAVTAVALAGLRRRSRSGAGASR